MANARIYIRRSDDDQSAYSPEAQERQCREWCTQYAHTVVGVYIDDDLSGTRDDRPNLQRLVKEARADAGSLVVVHKFDRLARDTEVLLRTVYKELLPRRVRVESVMERIDAYTPLGKLMLTYSGGVSTYFSDNLSTEVTKGLREKAERGGWVGPLPLGYRSRFELDGRGERIRNTGRAVPNDDAAVVRLIFDLYATGNHSFVTIAEQCNAAGHTIANKGARGPFTADAIGGILTNPFYIGIVRYNNTDYPGAHEPLIARDTWEHCQAIVRRRRQQGGGSIPGNRASGMLSEIVRCAHCDAPMHWIETGRASSRARARPTRACRGRRGARRPWPRGPW